MSYHIITCYITIRYININDTARAETGATRRLRISESKSNHTYNYVYIYIYIHTYMYVHIHICLFVYSIHNTYIMHYV